MNNKYITSLFCITVLALAPACSKRQESSSTKATKGTHSVAKEDINTMIELDNSVFEVEESNETQKSIVKF